MPALSPTSVTLAQARDTIRRPSGHAGQTNSVTHADEVLRDVITTLMNRRDWSFFYAATTAAVTAGDSELTLPTTLKKVYSVATPTNTLEFVTQREWDRIVPPDSPALGGTYVYTWFNAYDGGTIKLRDAVANNTTITINYVRRSEFPASATETFDLPEPLMDYVLSEARARYAADTGKEPTIIQYWDAKAKEALAAAISEDTRQPDRDKQILPGYLDARGRVGWRYDYNTGNV